MSSAKAKDGTLSKEAAPVINVALTKRGEMPMCGMPYHLARGYIEKLIAAGWRVAFCDQVGEVQAGKLGRRELSQILSAGTLDDFGLDDRKPNYLAAICKVKDGHGLAFCELSTGEFRLTEVSSVENLVDELARVSPAETIAPESQREDFTAIGGVLWAAGVTVLGYFLGQVAFIRDNLEMIFLAIVAISVIPIAIELMRHRARRPAANAAAQPEAQPTPVEDPAPPAG